MGADLNELPAAGGTSGLKVVVVYDETDSRHRANEVFDGLARTKAGSTRFAVEACPFNQLEAPAEAEAVLAEARAADVLVIAFQRRGLMPLSVAQWLESWAAARKQEDPALVLLSDETASVEEATASNSRTLLAWARRHGLECLEPADLHAGLAYRNVAANRWEREHAMTPTLKRFLERTDYWR